MIARAKSWQRGKRSSGFFANARAKAASKGASPTRIVEGAGAGLATSRVKSVRVGFVQCLQPQDEAGAVHTDVRPDWLHAELDLARAVGRADE